MEESGRGLCRVPSGPYERQIMWKATQAAAVTRAKQVSRSPQRSPFVFCLLCLCCLQYLLCCVFVCLLCVLPLGEGEAGGATGGVGWSWGRTRASTPTVHIKDIEKSFSFSVEFCSAAAQSLRCSFQPSFYDYKYLCLSRFSVLSGFSVLCIVCCLNSNPRQRNKNLIFTD